jgi:hypothetical protein
MIFEAMSSRQNAKSYSLYRQKLKRGQGAAPAIGERNGSRIL